MRWHYCGTRFLPAAIASGADPSSSLREGCIALPGFPGILVGIQDDLLGSIIDTRPSAPRPSRSYLLSTSSEQLVELLRTAITNQRRDLALHEVRLQFFYGHRE